MAHRLVIALTTLLGLTAATVVAAYLFLFSGSTDRAAMFAPRDAVAYVNVYLEPSAGQQVNLGALLGHVAGFGDAAALDTKIDEIAQRLIGNAGLDYRANLKPWLGGQVALAVSAPATADGMPGLLVLAAVRDEVEAEAAVTRLAARDGEAGSVETHAGEQVHLAADGAAYAIVDEVALLGATEDAVTAAIERHATGETLAAEPSFVSAMSGLPADHLASIYLDLGRAASLAGATSASLGTVGAALLAQPDGLRLVGSVPLDERQPDDVASSAAPVAASGLSEWLPAGTQAAAVIVRLGEGLAALEEAAASVPEAAEALTQLRALAVLGLGIDLEADLLPLLEGETAIGISGLPGEPRGVLVIAPRDRESAAATLERLATALESRGFERDEAEAAGIDVTTLAVPELGSVAYANVDDVILLALDPDDIGAAIEAHASGESLASDEAYREAFDLAGGRSGNEVYVDLADLIDSLGALSELDADTRAILDPIRSLGISAPVHDRRLELNAAVTVE